jgi:hypothetical protein
MIKPNMVKAAAARLVHKEQQYNALCAAQRARAQAFARKIAAALGRTDPALQKIIGFGSTFETWRHFRPDSDIDLGICGGNWGQLYSSIPSSEFTVSLIELDLQKPEFRDYVLQNGEVLYEKP